MPKHNAPTVFADSGHLGDRKLDGEGILARAKEDTRKQAQKNRIPFQEELEKQERSAGPRLSPSEFICRVKEENPAVIVKEGGVAGSVALYIYVEPRFREEEDEELKYVGGFPWQPLPEFAHVINDQHGVATREYRGWRSVLIGLVKHKVLTYAQAAQQFGEPVGPRADQWFRQLRDFKTAS